MRSYATIIGGLLLWQGACAGQFLDGIRNYDLNDYALGIAISEGQNPYVGAERGAYAYPYLTSFRDPSLTNSWLLVQGGDVGFRWVRKSGWEFAAVGRVQTLGLGNSDTDELLGIADRKWTLELGPKISWRGWPVHVEFKTYSEVSDRHDGLISELALSLPMEWSRGYIVPSIEIIRQNSDYADYYYSVSDAEATPTRPAYSPGTTSNLAIRARWGYALNQEWLLSGAVGLEKLDSTITNSPIVALDKVWSGRIGIAYNADLFQPRDYDNSAPRSPKFDLRVSAFQDSISTKVARDTSNGVPGFETDIEEFLGAADEKTVLQLDATVRLRHYHRIEFGYFELGRRSTATLSRDLAFGDEVFPEGTIIETSVDAKIFRAGYSYSLVRDAQKELGVTAGVHFAELKTDISSDTTGQVERTNAGTPLPVVGAHATIFLNPKIALGAKVQVFRTDFDRYEGSLNYATMDLQYRVTDATSVGVGYNYYAMKLSSNESEVNGYLKVRHRGPAAFFTIGF